MEKTEKSSLNELSVKPILKRNYIVYFYGYFAGSVIGTIVHVFLPIYFFNVLNVDRMELAFVQIFSYSALFVKLLVSMYFDRNISKAWLFMILSSFGLFGSFVLLLMSVNILAIFGLFLGIYFVFSSILDVAIDKYIVAQSPTIKIKQKNALYLNLGALSGAILPNLVSLFLLTDVFSIDSWSQFFFIGILSIAPLLGIIFMFKAEELEPKKETLPNEKTKFSKHILLMCLFLFLCYADSLYQYPLEPWALNKLGAENIGLFSLFMIVFIIVNALGFVIAGTISHKFDRKKVLIASTLIDGVLITVAPFTDIIVFFILISIVYIFSGFIVINMISLMIEFSKSSVLYYQVMSLSITLSSVVFVPFGTFLSAIIPTEIIIAIAGILIILSIVPLFFIDVKDKG